MDKYIKKLNFDFVTNQRVMQHSWRAGSNRLLRSFRTCLWQFFRNKTVGKSHKATVAQKTVKIADLSAAFPNISPNTLKKDVQYLRDEQIVSTVGQGKGTVYVIK